LPSRETVRTRKRGSSFWPWSSCQTTPTELKGYCHCSSCRQWSASPVNGFTLWKPDAVAVVKGASEIGTFNKTNNSYRKWCTVCGGHLMNEHPVWGLIDVYAAVIPEFPFKAAVHVNYQESVLPLHDGVPKLKDVPTDLGGSNELMAA